jgi:DNA repair protein RecN (Recombination protein N)
LLLELRVKNLGIIDEIRWKPGHGLNVITGETGAGKSLVIDSMETLLGGKAREDSVRSGADTAEIEGIFDLPPGENMAALRALMAEKGITAEDDHLIIHCEVPRQGRSLIRANGRAVPRIILQQIEGYLVDIHGQSEHLSLLDRRTHLDFLDSYAHVMGLRQEFGARAAELTRAEQELKKLVLDEINRANLREDEEEELERERNILTACEQLKAFSSEAYQAIYGEDNSSQSSSIVDKLGEAVQTMKRLVNLDATLKSQLEILEETAYRLADIGRAIRDYGDNLERDPARLEEVESRLEMIKDLKRKYGQTVGDALAYLDKVEKDLAGLSHSSERRVELEQVCPRLREEMGKIAAELSTKRRRAADQLVTEVRKELNDLNMSRVEFEVSITQVPSVEGILLPGDDKIYAFSNDGVDTVEFMAATNPGEPLKPVASIASTGEVSRFMLALKGALSGADNIPVLVFDEIDIGVGGRSGEIIGEKLWRLARNRQVICVTHLPQIAAFADVHFTVRKEVSGKRTLSRLERLQNEGRVEEVAAMLAGPRYTETALRGAHELVNKATAWKESAGLS